MNCATTVLAPFLAFLRPVTAIVSINRYLSPPRPYPRQRALVFAGVINSSQERAELAGMMLHMADC